MKENGVHQDNERETERWVEDLLSARLPDENWQPNATRGFARFLARGNRQPRSRTWTWAATGLLATSLTVAAFPATRAFAQRCVSVCANQSSRIWGLLTGDVTGVAPSNTFIKESARKIAPDFALADASGRIVKLSDLRGKVVLLNFWATWCVPCQAEIPLLTGFQQTYGDRNFTVLGVSVDEDGWTSVRPYMNEKRMNYHVMIGNSDVARSYGGLDTIPTTLIIDRSGRIAATHLGLCRKDEYDADIQTVLKEL